MSTITTLNSGDSGPVSRGVLNTNLANLNSDKIETSVLDTDGTLAANSDVKVATQKAVKSYVDTTSIAADKSCFVYQNASATVGTDDNVALLFQLESFDTDTMHDSVSNTSRITFTTAGKYHFGGTLDADGAVSIKVVLNGTTTLAGNATAGTLGVGNISASGIYNFAQNDYIEIFGDAGSSGYVTSGTISTNFWAYKIN